MAPLSGEVETITVPREHERRLCEFRDYLAAGGLRDASIERPEGFETSYYGRGGRRYPAFMHPAAAYRAKKEGGEDYSGYLGFQGRRALGQMNFAQPDIGDLHVDALLTEVSMKYANEELIGSQVFPRVQVEKPSDYYVIFDSAPWRRDEGSGIVRGLGARGVRGGYSTSTDTYRVERYTFEHDIDDALRDAADSPFDLDNLGAEFCAMKIDMRLEKIVAGLVFTGANWTNVTLSGTGQWNDAGSNPFADAKTARLTVRKQLGQGPNTMVMGVEVFETLSLHAGLIERVKYTGTQERPAMVTARMIAALFGVDRLLVGGCVENTAVEQIPDVETLAYVWGKKVWFGYVAPRPARELPSSGYIFTKGRKADRYRDEPVTSDVIRCEEELDVKQTSQRSGYLIQAAIA